PSFSLCLSVLRHLCSPSFPYTTLFRSISSGKDVYIHYAAPEFAFALSNDERSKAAVLYCEPGGYYELDARNSLPVRSTAPRPCCARRSRAQTRTPAPRNEYIRPCRWK